MNLTLSVVSAVDVETNLNNDSDDIECIDVVLNDNFIDVDGNVLDEGSEDVNNELFNPISDLNSDEIYNSDIVVTNLQEDSPKINSNVEGVNNCIWLWSTNMNSINLTLLADSGINNILLFYKAFIDDNVNVTKFIEDCDNLGIKVHAWMQCFYDGKTWKYPKYNDTEFNQTFVDELINEALFYVKNYNVAGVHLDYVRYGGSAHQREGSIEAVTEVVRQMTAAIKDYNPNLIVSAAVMPEINMYNETLTWNEYYYGQNVTAMSQYLDVIIPMIYKGNFKKDSAWIKNTTELFVNASVHSQIWTGLQAYRSDNNVTPLSSDELKFDSKCALEGGATALVFFRDVLINYFNVTELYVSNISASVSDINFGENAIIDVVVNPSVVIGDAIVYVDGKKVDTVELNKGQAKSIISNLNAGKHNFTVVYSGNYLPSSYSGYFMVNPKMININVDPVKGEAGEKVKITTRITDVDGNPVSEGTVIISFNGKEYEANVVNGIATVEVVLPNKAGTYSATAYYEGFNYNSSYTTFTVEVSDISSPNPNTTPVNKGVGNMENTGNPILVLLIALSAIGLESFRRKL